MEDEIDLADIVYILRKNILLILLVFLVIFGGMAFYTFTTPKLYEASSYVLVSSTDQTAILLGQPVIRMDVGTQAAIVKSSSVLIPVFKQLGGNFEIDVLPIKDASVIQIKATSPDPMTAKQASDLVAESYVNYTVESRQHEALEVINFINIQIQSYQKELDILNKALQGYEGRELTGEEKIQMQSLKQEISAKEKLFNSLLARREEVGILAREDSSNIRIIEFGQYPFFPVKPNILLNLVLGVILGMMGGVGIAYFKEYIRNTYRSSAEIEADFGPVIVGNIAKVKTNAKGYKRYLMQHSDPQGKFAEDMRMLRTNLMFLLKDRNIKTVVVTSPQEGDGKTMVSVNLALALAHNNYNVLLVDANIRRPLLYKIFSREGPGLTDVILDETSIGEAMFKTNLENLDVLFAGKPNSSPSEIVSSNRMKDIIRIMKGLRYDVVIFDASSLNFSESAFMTTHTDGTLLVIGFDVTKRETAKHAKKVMEKVKAKLLGVIVNSR